MEHELAYTRQELEFVKKNIGSQGGRARMGIEATPYVKFGIIREMTGRDDNAPQESLFGHMKDEIDLKYCDTHEQVVALKDDWMDYYNNERYQWDLARLSPNEYYGYLRSGVYPLTVKPPRKADSS